MHLPRAMALFAGQGLTPVAAPTEHLSKPSEIWWRLPTAKNLMRTEYWIHEQLGRLWAQLMGQIDKLTSDE